MSRPSELAVIDELRSMTEHGPNCHLTDDIGCVCGLTAILERSYEAQEEIGQAAALTLRQQIDALPFDHHVDEVIEAVCGWIEATGHNPVDYISEVLGRAGSAAERGEHDGA